MRLLLDEQISGRVAVGLRERGFDVLTVDEFGQHSADDPDLWRAAIAAGRVVVSYNVRDFAPLFQRLWDTGVGHAGLVLVHPSTIPSDDFGALVRTIEYLASLNEDLANQVLFLQRAPEP
jgi:hypothetical protein